MAEHTVLLDRHGRECPIADSAAPILDADGNITGVVLVFRDETVERKAKQLLSQQNLELEERVKDRTAELLASEENLRNVVNSVPALIAFINVDQRYVYANRTHLDQFAPLNDDITGKTVSEVLGPERYAIVQPMIARVLRGESLQYDWQPFPDTWLQVNYVPRLDKEGRTVGYYVLGTDISERRKHEQKVSQLNALLSRHVSELKHVSRALRTLSAGNRSMLHAKDEQDLVETMCREIVSAGGYHMACVWYALTDESNRLQPIAQAGYPGGIEHLRTIAEKGGACDPEAQTAVATAIRTGETILVPSIADDPAYAPWRKNMEGFGCGIAIPLRIDGIVVGALAMYSTHTDDFSQDEISLLVECAGDMAFGISTFRIREQQQRTREEMHELTYFDATTRLPNEAQFIHATATVIARVEAGEPGFTVMQIRIDRLPEINSALGFGYGDQLLRQFGERLRQILPDRATVARLRGAEFAVLLPDSSVPDAALAAMAVEEGLVTPFTIAQLPVEISVRVGIAHYPDHAQNAQDLLRHMDIAVRRARAERVRHIVYEPAYSEGQAESLMLVGELRSAIVSNALALYLQPKVDMQTGQICGAEGLIRWRHPERGLIHPGVFIPVAEQTELIRPLTEWVAKAALRFNEGLADSETAYPIAINLSSSNLRDEHLLKKIQDMRIAFSVAPGLLEIELTESVLMENAERSMIVLDGLRKDGIPLYIDDFGTGYSSLSYLQKLPVDYIKIDQSFVNRMLHDKSSAVIVKATIDLAHDLGRKVAAEGVETQEQWNLLAGFDCDMAQGYLISKPLPMEDFRNWTVAWEPIAQEILKRSLQESSDLIRQVQRKRIQ